MNRTPKRRPYVKFTLHTAACEAVWLFGQELRHHAKVCRWYRVSPDLRPFINTRYAHHKFLAEMLADAQAARRAFLEGRRQ